ncbi:DUF4926 domain-containing protein [Pantoea wallisii]|nr:DUF4926 domain-containing protein [Pantoea wallisii]
MRDDYSFNKENSGELAKQVVFEPSKAVQTSETSHGVKYDQVISITGVNGRVIDVKFGWIKNNDGVVRLVTAIPTKKITGTKFMIEEYDIVESIKVLSDSVVVGCKGTVVMIYTDPILGYEVEFMAANGETLDVLTVYPDDIRLLD